MHPESLAGHLRKLGVPTGSARTAAIRQHGMELPAPVVADAVSYHPVTAAKIATQIGVTGSLTFPLITLELAMVDYASSPVREAT